MPSKSLTDLELSLHSKLFNQIEFEERIHSSDIFSQNESKYSFQDLLRRAEKILEKEGTILPASKKKKLLQNVVYRIIGLGPIQPLIEDTCITEIMVNGKDRIFIEKEGKIQKVNLSFASNNDVLQVINRIVSRIGRRIDESSPMVDARLPDGSRVNAIIPPLSLIGPILTIRKFSETPFSIEMLLKNKSINKEMADFLTGCVVSKQNILISGGTGSGKTSLLNALSRLIPSSERIITIEDSAEMRLNHENLVSLESRPPNIEGKGEITIRILLKNALRMRPDRIIVGEIRGTEALDMLQAMNTGHKGSLTTIHANAPLEALLRLETMTIMAEAKIPLQAIQKQICKSIDIIIQQERSITGKRRITCISELTENKSTGEYKLNDIFVFDKKKKEHVKTKYKPECLEEFEYYEYEENLKFNRE